jgi:membrane peptidoglycan carboxypeptidase
VSDHRNHRHRASEPAWPTGEDPKPRGSAQQPERTGFWSPLWEDDDDDSSAVRPANGHGRRAQSNGSPNGGSNGHARNGANGHARQEGSNGHARKGGDAGAHAWPEAEPPAAARRAEPPGQPRPAGRRGAAPVWPSSEEAPPPRRPGGPHTPPPGAGGRPPAGPATRVVRPRPAGPPRPGAPGRPGPDPNGPTEVLQPAHRGPGPEPQLLTHREPDYDEDVYDDPDLEYDEDEDRPLSDTDRKLRRRKIWRRVRRTGYVLTALMIIGPVLAFFVSYQMVEVPTPESVAASQQQVVTLQFADGSPLSQIVPEDGSRTFVKYEQLPEVVKNAVFAAEDAEFMTNPGFDIGGVMRAGWNQATGGAGGGSTITQQYIKMATGDDEASGISGYSRKALEVVKAYKMNKTFSKPQILEAYLNTIYFGRSANGIAAAAKAYYGKPLDQLNASEAALLGGMIQSPGKYRDTAYMERRHKFVLDQMVDKGWLSAAERQQYTALPALAPVENARPSAIEGPGAHIQKAVLDEVENETGLSLAQLKQRGYTIVTTIDPNAQRLAQEAVDSVMKGQPANLLPAMVAVDPTTGEVRAYYGGANGNGIDWAKQRQEPGSSFKPFDLVALLEKGKGLGEKYDGSSGRQFGGPDSPKIRNAGGDTCGKECTVALAMKKSINTVFYDIALNTVGTQAVANAAHQAGITSDLGGANGGAPDGNIAIGGGTTQVSTLEMASAYATFAANGMYRAPHLVKKIITPDGKIFWEPSQASTSGKMAFDPGDETNNAKIARNVTEALLPIPKSSNIGCANGRQCAGKTGTHQLGETEDNAKAWMVGYTPQISAAVSMAAEENSKQMPLMNSKGKIVYGSGLPGQIWQKFMNSYLEGQPKQGFGKFVPIGKAADDEDEGKTKNNNTSPNTNTQPTDNGNNTPPNGNGNGNNTTTTDPTDPEDPSTDPDDPGGPGNNTCIPPFCNPDDN